MQLYWNIGKRLSEEGLEKGYGGSVVERLSIDLDVEVALRDIHKPIGVADYRLQFPTDELKALINRELSVAR
jgi:hypothetical protein